MARHQRLRYTSMERPRNLLERWVLVDKTTTPAPAHNPPNRTPPHRSAEHASNCSAPETDQPCIYHRKTSKPVIHWQEVATEPAQTMINTKMHSPPNPTSPHRLLEHTTSTATIAKHFCGFHGGTTARNTLTRWTQTLLYL